MQNIEIEIKKIYERNKKVEAEKAWETSKERKFLIILITYAFMCFFMNLIESALLTGSKSTVRNRG